MKKRDSHKQVASLKNKFHKKKVWTTGNYEITELGSSTQQHRKLLMQIRKKRTKCLNQPENNNNKTLCTLTGISKPLNRNLNLNSLNSPIKCHRLSKWIRKEGPVVICWQEMNFTIWHCLGRFRECDLAGGSTSLGAGFEVS